MTSIDQYKEAADRITAKPSSDPVRSFILLVDDEEAACRNYKKLFHRRGSQHVKTANSAEQAVEILKKCPHIGVVITDLRMPGHGGVWLGHHIRENYPGVPVVALTAYHERFDDLNDLFDRVYEKPPDLNKLVRDVYMMVLKAA